MENIIWLIVGIGSCWLGFQLIKHAADMPRKTRTVFEGIVLILAGLVDLVLFCGPLLGFDFIAFLAGF